METNVTFDDRVLMIRICRACGAAASQKPNGSYLCVKCDPTVSYQEFVAMIRSGAASDDLHIKLGTDHRPLTTEPKPPSSEFRRVMRMLRGLLSSLVSTRKPSPRK